MRAQQNSCSAALKPGQKEGENKQRRRSCTIITIPFPREKERDQVRKKGEPYQERAAKSDKSGSLTASTFERRNPVMQIRFSAVIFLLLPRAYRDANFFPSSLQFLHRRNLAVALEFHSQTFGISVS